MNFLLSFLFFLLLMANAWAEELRDVQPPVNLPTNNLWLYFLILAVIGLIAFIMRKHLFKKRSPDKKSLTSWEAALKKLEELKTRQHCKAGRYKEFYGELSQILRRYIEERFSIRAPEMTTEEFLISLKQAPELNDAQKTLLKDFLHSSDIVKFARHTPSEKDGEESYHFVKVFIEETVPPEIPKK